jgi:hypothetical protein
MKNILTRRSSMITGVLLSTVLSLAGVVAFSGAASAAVSASVSRFCVELDTGHAAITAVGMPVTGSLYGRAVATLSENRADLTGLRSAARIAPSTAVATSLNSVAADFTSIDADLTQEIALHPATAVQQSALNKEAAGLAKIHDNTSPAYGRAYKAFQVTLAKLNALNARAIVFDNEAVVTDKALVQLQVSIVATPVFFTCRNDKQVVETAGAIAHYSELFAEAHTVGSHVVSANVYVAQAASTVSSMTVSKAGTKWTVSNGIAEACITFAGGRSHKYTVSYGGCK